MVSVAELPVTARTVSCVGTIPSVKGDSETIPAAEETACTVCRCSTGATGQLPGPEQGGIHWLNVS